ncbi:hypothetical protein [Cesiribacter andamanensis]|uniref:Outer membrane protein beta-barrel domain-containing protein n=1 Tax=Cesiribacter andamanensis AMV16 TaxID=1279009 RepID=M7NWQ4_9BACT|nr:hypothetical protein [Cesiribacter andamanensis]EMR02879.1 hypothetical protein ADICEAN_01973 [Cesiribacter andamanensis AMV16]
MRKLHDILVAGGLSALLLLSVSCERTADPNPDRLGWSYYPLKLGDYRLYDVYRIQYNFATPNDTLEYELLERVADYYLNQTNDTIFILRRQRRYSQGGSWQLDSSYSVQRTPRQLVQGINNRPQVQLVFPLGEGIRWNSNMLNASPADTFEMRTLGRTFTVDNTVYDTSLRVVQEDIDDVIVKRDMREEVYALGVGLVYKLTDQQNYCTTNCSEPGSITSGLFLEMKLKEHGNDTP